MPSVRKGSRPKPLVVFFTTSRSPETASGTGLDTAEAALTSARTVALTSRRSRPRRGWLVVRVVLLAQAGEELAGPPGRDVLVRDSHTFADLAAAIDRAFARWDLSHLHEFRLIDGRRLAPRRQLRVRLRLRRQLGAPLHRATQRPRSSEGVGGLAIRDRACLRLGHDPRPVRARYARAGRRVGLLPASFLFWLAACLTRVSASG